MFKKNVVFHFFCSFRLHIFIVKNHIHTFLSGTLLVKLFFSNHHFQYFQIWLFRAHFQKECGFWVDSGLISSKTTFFLGILLVRWFSQITFSNHHFWIWLFGADFQKECVFWVGSGLISRKTTFPLRILLVKIVFSNHFHKSLFSNLAHQSRFRKRMCFLCRFRLNLIKNHVPFENSAREGGFLKAPESRLCRFIDFHNECGFWVDLGLRILWA